MANRLKTFSLKDDVFEWISKQPPREQSSYINKLVEADMDREMKPTVIMCATCGAEHVSNFECPNCKRKKLEVESEKFENESKTAIEIVKAKTPRTLPRSDLEQMAYVAAQAIVQNTEANNIISNLIFKPQNHISCLEQLNELGIPHVGGKDSKFLGMIWKEMKELGDQA